MVKSRVWGGASLCVAACTAGAVAPPVSPVSPASPYSPAPPVTDAETYSWIQVTADGTFARSVTTAAHCPTAKLNGTPTEMALRGATTPPKFDVRVCEVAIAGDVTTVSVDGTGLSLPPSVTPSKIVVVGDTGCRIAMLGGHVRAQACEHDNDPHGWQFPKMAKAIAAAKPDIIVHLGDYNYREVACPEGNKGCAGSPFGDEWETWQADWFAPAAELLPAAPWVFIRGNHEDCERDWIGWFLFLGRSKLPNDPWDPKHCREFTDPYRVDLGDLALAVVDSASGPKGAPDPVSLAEYTRQFRTIPPLISGDSEAWMITHRPSGAPSWTGGGQHPLIPTDQTLSAAIHDAGGLPPQVTLSIAGHVHQFQKMTFDDGRPMQLVLGGGGTSLVPPITPDVIAEYPDVFTATGVDPEDFTMLAVFSFAVLTREGKTWTVSLRDPDGTELMAFPLPAPVGAPPRAAPLPTRVP